MRKLVYYIAVSIDGYLAGPDGETEFYPTSDDMAAWMTAEYPETVPTHIRAAAGLGDLPNKTFDTLVMGRGTYQVVLDVGITNPYAHLRTYVASTTLTPAPGVEVYDGDPVELVRKLKVRGRPGHLPLRRRQPRRHPPPRNRPTRDQELPRRRRRRHPRLHRRLQPDQLHTHPAQVLLQRCLRHLV